MPYPPLATPAIFDQLLNETPAAQRDQITFFATDKSGHRAAYYRRAAADHWYTTHPYVMISDDPSMTAWQTSLIGRPGKTIWQLAADWLT